MRTSLRLATGVVGVGASSVDYVYVLPEAPAAGGRAAKLRVQERFVSCGGQVATAMAACAAFGLRARYLGPFGTDANARTLRAELIRRGVDLEAAVEIDAANQYAVILVDSRTGERIVLWDRDPALAVGDTAPFERGLEGARVLHVDDVDEGLAIAMARAATARGLIVTSDIDRLTERTEELVASVTVAVFDAHVPAALTGERDPEQALRALRRTQPGLMVVTCGAAGAIALDGDRLVRAAALPVEAVDTTAAGDVFRAGLISGLVRGWPLERTLAFANAAAGLSCTRRGAMSGIPAVEDVHRAVDRAAAPPIA